MQSVPAIRNWRKKMKRRTLMKATLAAATLGGFPAIRGAHADTPGVTATEIKIGQTQAYSGPVSQYGIIGRTQTVFFKMINDKGGIAGRKINFLSVDDGYQPPKTVEQTRRLVEQEGVAFMFNSLGTPTNSAVHRYLNQKKVPQLFVATGADKWGNPKEFPWTIGWQPSYRTEALIYARHILETKPNARIGIIFQNDDFGKDYVVGIKEALGDKFDQMVKTVSYEATDATLDSQLVTLQGAGVDTLVGALAPKFAAMSIRKVFDMGWKPVFYLSNVSLSVGSVIQPAGPEKAVGVISADFRKDAVDATWKDDPGMNEWRAFMKQHMPEADISDNNYSYGYATSLTLMQVLKQCGDDFSRENIMKQAANLKDLENPILLPGIKINTSPTNFRPIQQMQLQKWNGKSWELFGKVIGASAG
jgi:branched-chain amino acid transport system substrate-binding protein